MELLQGITTTYGPKSPPRRAVAAITVLSVAVLFLGAAGVAFYPGGVSMVSRQIDGVADLLGARSPGERQVGELTKVKTRGLGSAAPLGLPLQSPAEERALGKVFPARSSGGGPSPVPRALELPPFGAGDGVPLGLPLFPSETALPVDAGFIFSPPAPGAGGFILPPSGPGAERRLSAPKAEG